MLTVNLLGVCFAIYQCAAENNDPQLLNPDQKLFVTIFDDQYKANVDGGLWSNLCEVILKFPKGLITMEYRPGSLAKGTVDNLSCPRGDCNEELLHGCEAMKDKKVNICGVPADESEKMYIEQIDCFCKKESSQFILDNAKLREKLNIPENKIPTLAFNEVYYPNAKLGSIQEIQDHVCFLYQYKVLPCKPPS